jgi:DNA-binding MarR family transcriptional regulator
VLLRFSASGTLPLKVIGTRLMVHPTSVTNAITRLAAAGLVDRRANPQDRRGVLASITERGRVVAEEATRDLMAIDFGLSGLATDTREAVFTALRRVRAEAGDFQEKPPPETVS